MPIYEFRCKTCNNDFEVLFLSFNESLDVSCPSCDSKNADRLMSVFGGKIGNTSAGGAGCSGCSATSCSTTCGH